MGRLPVMSQLTERLPEFFMDNARAGEVLPPLNNEVAVSRIDLDAVAAAADLLGRDQRAARTQERIEDELAASCTIHHCIGQHRDRLHRRVQLQEVEILAGIAPEAVGGWIIPDVA